MASDPDRPSPSRFWPRALSNSIWLSADRLVRGAVNLTVLICIGRFLGPELYGLYSYAVAFVAIFVAFGSVAHEGILVRELVREGPSSGRIMGAGFFLRAIGGLAGMCLAIGVAFLLPGTHADAGLVAIIAIGLLFQPFEIIDYWFQSRLQSRYAAGVRIGGTLLAGAGKITLALHLATLPALAWMSVAEALLVAIALSLMYWRKGPHPVRWHLERSTVRTLFRESKPMAASILLVLLFMKLDQIMLAWYVGFREMGIYASAVRLVDLWNFIPLAVMPSLYPIAVKLHQQDKTRYLRFLHRLFVIFFLLSLGIVGMNLLLGKSLLRLFFGAEYVGAAPALCVLSISTIFNYSSFIRAQWLFIEHKVIYHLWAAGIGVLTLVGFNMLLIPRFGPIGAAMSTVMGYAVTGYGTSLFFRALRPVARLQTRAFFFRWRYKLKGARHSDESTD